MLSAQEIANYLVKNLDAIAATKPDGYQFSILAEVGKGYDGKKINGMVRTVSPELSTYPVGYLEAKYLYAVELFVSGPSNYRYLTVNAIIDEFIKANQCANVEFENGKGVVTFVMGAPKNYKIEHVVGEGLPLIFTVHVTYTENGVTSGDKRWFLDGNKIPYLTESVYVEREGMNRKQFTEAYNKTILTGQTKFYSFRIPYESSLYKSLQIEILDSTTANGVKHTLTYYDGAAFTEEAPFTATVRIYRTAKSDSRRPDGAAFEVTFTDVYNSDNYENKYYIALIDFPFDMQGNDTRFFNSTTEQVDYFEEKAVASSAPFVEIEAPNLDSLVITKQVYGKSSSPWASQFDFVNKNYAVIKAVSEAKTYYFYYFITNSVIGADGFVMVDLKLDTVQTYFFDKNITFSDCLIERAHLNRFVPVEGSTTYVKFVTDPASKIYNSEQGLNFPKRLVERNRLSLKFTGNTTIDRWLIDNVAYWVYVFIDSSKKYKTCSLYDDEDKNTTVAIKTKYLDELDGATAAFCYPVYKGENKIYFKSSHSTVPILLDYKGRQVFEQKNEISSYYYTIKISLLPPFDEVNFAYTIENKNLNIWVTPLGDGYGDGVGWFFTKTMEKATEYAMVYGKFYYSGTPYGLIWSLIQKNTSIESFSYLLPENDGILKEEIIMPQKTNLAYNPKLNSQNFKELVITASSGDSFAYDIQKLNGNFIIFEYSEPITPEVTKYYLRVKGGTGLYEEGTDENYMGLVGSTDNSLAYCNDQYAEFIANNKNFFMQSNMKIALGAGSNVADAAQKALSGDIVGVAASGLKTIKDVAVSVIDREMTIDNMKNAPDQLKNANGNVIFNMFATDLGLHVEKYSALEGDLKTANDFMNLYGFSFSAIANVRDYVNIRKYHNYIQAQLQSINGNLSNMARQDLRQRFAEGIRFWNNDTITYEYENYENWLNGYINFESWLEEQKQLSE